MRSRTFTVALIGPDGAGKTTVARRLEKDLQMPAKYLYMGVNPDSSNHLLPTTRLVRALKRVSGAEPDTAGPPDPRQLRKPPPSGVGRRALSTGRASLRLANRLAEEWYRQLVAWKYLRRGSIVVFDRHFFSDFYAYDIAPDGGRQLSRRIHGFLLSRIYPKPDLVIFLDAPAEVLLARKGEGTIEALARRREEYRDLAQVTRHFAVVDAGRAPGEVVHDVSELIRAFAAERAVETPSKSPRTG